MPLSLDGTGSITGIGTFNFSDEIIHVGDTNTKIRFPAADTVSVETAGSERFRIDANGKITHTNFGGVGFTMSGTGDPTFQISDADGTNQYVQLAHNGGDSYIVTRNNTSHGEFLVYSQNGSATLPRIKIGSDGTWSKYYNSSSTVQAAFGGTGQVNGITALPSMAGNPFVVGRDTGTTRSAHFGGHLQFDSGYGIQGTEFSVYGNTSGLYLNSNVSGDAIIFQTHNGSSVGERLRIDSSGRLIQRYSAAPYGNRAATFQSPAGETSTYIAVVNTETNGASGILFGDHAGQNAGNFDAYINYSHQYQHLQFLVGSGTERLRIKSDGDVSISDGNLIVANGHGIDFSATADGGTGTPSELLDDYEEGYFAPEITNLSSGYGSGTFYNRQARYTKVGNMVTCWVHIQFWGVASTSGSDNLELTVTGFPFEVDGVGYSGSCGGGLQSQSWRYSGSTWNNYATTSNNVQPRINSLEQIRFGVCGHNSITGQVTQKSINGYAPNIEFVFTVRVTTYK